MAVGARRGQVVWMILKDSLALTVAGVVIGVPLAMLVGRALTRRSMGSSRWMRELSAGGAGVAVVALAASAAPAGRAASVDPMKALRTE